MSIANLFHFALEGTGANTVTADTIMSILNAITSVFSVTQYLRYDKPFRYSLYFQH